MEATEALTYHFSAFKASDDRFSRYPDCPSTSQWLPLKSLPVCKPVNNINNVLFISRYTLAPLQCRLGPVPAADSDVTHPLHQVIWSTFVSHIPNIILPGTMAAAAGVAAVFMARMENFKKKGVKFAGAISGWTATLLLMWIPVLQMDWLCGETL